MLALSVAQKLEAKFTAEWPLYLALLKEVRRNANTGHIDFAAKQIFKDARKRGLIANDAPADPELLYRLASETLPGPMLWLVNTILSPYDRIKMAAASARLAQRVPTAPPADNAYAEALKQEGFLMLPPLLDRAKIEHMKEFLSSREAFTTEGTTRKNKIEDVVAAPFALELATNHDVLAYAAHFLGGPPTIVDMDAWHSPVTGINDYGPQVLHRDKDDFRACKFFVYLTDVDEASGPHVYVRRTHDPDFVRETITGQGLPPGTINDAFNLDKGGRPFAQKVPEIFKSQLTVVKGNAGSCFMIDSFGYHQGRPPEKNPRTMFSVTYGLVAYPNRIDRFGSIDLTALPSDCEQTPLARHAARLVLS